MSPIALGLDLILATLLISALVLGLRLNKRLKVLREGQLGFAKAVLELDSAAARAEAGLKALRIASEDAHDTLLTRIETARGLAAKLEAASAQAAAAAAVVEPTPGPAPVSRSLSRLDPRFRAEEPPVARRPAVRNLDDDLFEAPEPRAFAGARR